MSDLEGRSKGHHTDKPTTRGGSGDRSSRNGGRSPRGTRPAAPPIDEVISHLDRVKPSGSGYDARCPAHNDKDPSLSVSEGEDGRVLLNCHAGCTVEAITAAMGMTVADLFPDSDPAPAPTDRYVYEDEDGGPLFRVVRKPGKRFYQERWTGRGWEPGVKGVRRVPYHLPELIAGVGRGETVYVAEGEKDVEAIELKGGVATCNPGGAGKWRNDFSAYLEGADVVVVADDDEPGIDHARKVARSLEEAAGSVRIVQAATGNDAYDHLAAGHGLEDFVPLEKETPEPDEDRRGPRIINLADVKPEPVFWLWPRRIPLGKLSILDGDPGLGKSSIALDLAARLSRGGSMPDGSDTDIGGPAGTVLLTAEDGLADTIRPRLDAAGADPTRIAALRAVPNGDDERLPTVRDVDDIEEAIERVDAKLLVIDPLVAYLGGDVNSYRDQDVRAALTALSELADRRGVAILAIRHLNKGSAGNPLYRGGGSIGLIAAARSGLLVAADPDDETEKVRVLAHTKSNLAAPPPALTYSLDTTRQNVRVRWGGETSRTAAELLATRDDEDRSAKSDAMEFLREELANGPVAAPDVKKRAKAAGHAWITVRRAADRLNVEKRKRGFAKGWEWVLHEGAHEGRASSKNGDTSNFEGTRVPQGDSGSGRYEGGHFGEKSTFGENGGSDAAPDVFDEAGA